MSKVPVMPFSSAALAAAALALQGGRLVAFPTETVYGLGADATSDAAVAALYAAKGRPQFNPLIVHVNSGEEAEALVRIGPEAEALMLRFWPGPLTLVLPRTEQSSASLLCSAGLDSLAVRCPSHPVARALIDAAGVPLAAPSANRSGTVSPTTPLHVSESFAEAGGEAIAMVLAAGKCAVGVESTVLDLSGERPTLLRPGAVLVDELEEVLGRRVVLGAETSAAPKAPGQLASHYAPRALVRLNAATQLAGEAYLAFGPQLRADGLNLSEQGDLVEAAANLFAMLRQLDATGAASIAVAPIPNQGLGVAINDRLQRAAAPRG